MTLLVWCLLPLLIYLGWLALIWFGPAEAEIDELERRGDHERHHRRVTRDWRAIVRQKRAERRQQAEARRQENWLIVRRNYPQWLADLGDAFSATDYDSCYELARYTCLALVYAERHLGGRFTVRGLYRHAAGIGAVENRRLHSREFFEALGRALEAQALLTPSRGNRGRRVRPDALERLAATLPGGIGRELFGG